MTESRLEQLQQALSAYEKHCAVSQLSPAPICIKY
jgi:hypothetical protein